MKDNSATKKPFSFASLGPPLLAGLLVGVGVYFCVCWIRANAQSPQPSDAPAATTKPALRQAQDGAAGFDALKGRWVRQDGGYVVVINGVDASGKIDAAYLNPRPINVAKAQASRKDGAVAVFIELRDTGYPGCTYNLKYDPQADQLAGIYYQAAQKQQYTVTFAKAK